MSDEVSGRTNRRPEGSMAGMWYAQDMQPDGDESVSGQYECPHCSAPFVCQVPPTSTTVNCPECGGLISLEPTAPSELVQDDLDANHIRQVTALRRSAYRSLSYCIIVAVVLVVAAVQIAWNLVDRLRTSAPDWVAALYAIAIPACLGGAFWLSRRALQYHREAARTLLEGPSAPPRFDGLSDGSQHWRNLKGMALPPTDPSEE